MFSGFHRSCKNSDRQTDLSKQFRPRSDAPNAASFQGLRCLPIIEQFLDTVKGSKKDLFKLSVQGCRGVWVSECLGKIQYELVNAVKTHYENTPIQIY